MDEHALARGGAVLRSAPWPVVLPFTALAGGFFGLAIRARDDQGAMLLALVAIGTCGAVAGYVLDEEACEVADATPMARPRRAAWRVAIALGPAALAAAALVWAARLTPETHALRMLPIVAGSVAFGLALASAMRRSGMSAPGELAGVLTFGTVVLVVLADPLRRWVSLRGFDGADYPARTALAWAAVIVVCAWIVVACERDPGSSRRSVRRRKVER
jgi:hypothetical protein